MLKKLISKFIEFKFLWDEHIDVQLTEDEVKSRFSQIPQYILDQRDKHIGTVKIVSSILLAANSSAMLFLLNSKKSLHSSFIFFFLGLFASISSFLLLYGFYCDTYKSTVNFGVGNQSFLNFVKYEYMINHKLIKFELFSILISIAFFSYGIAKYI